MDGSGGEEFADIEGSSNGEYNIVIVDVGVVTYDTV